MPVSHAILGVALSTMALALGCGDGGRAPSPTANKAPVASDSNKVMPLGTSRDSRATQELAGHVPAALAASAETEVGTDTGETIPDGGTTTLHEAAKTEHLVPHVERMTHVARAKGSIERLLRATVYFTLVDRCRAADGSILPPASVKLHFIVLEDGTISPTSVEASAKDPAFKSAAQCMERELVAASFHAPADTGGETTTVNTDVPSVD